jgi:hypothetical protein
MYKNLVFKTYIYLIKKTLDSQQKFPKFLKCELLDRKKGWHVHLKIFIQLVQFLFYIYFILGGNFGNFNSLSIYVIHSQLLCHNTFHNHCHGCEHNYDP